jgi:hypothetical protein
MQPIITESTRNRKSENPTVNIISGEKLKSFIPRSSISQGCPLSWPVLNLVLKFLARAITQGKEGKIIQILREVKLSLHMTWS